MSREILNFNPVVECCVCGVQIYANDPDLGEWRAFQVDGDPSIYYACPDEFPGRSPEELGINHLEVLRTVIERTLAVRKPYRV